MHANPPPVSSVNGSQYFQMNQLCKVCGEPAAGFHFGAFTCEGCKSFFGRTYNNLSSLNECKNNGRCIINKKNRTSCKACRLRKCLMVGMSKSGSRYGRRSNWFKIHCLMQEQAQALESSPSMSALHASTGGVGFPPGFPSSFSASLSMDQQLQAPPADVTAAGKSSPVAKGSSSPCSDTSNPAQSPVNEEHKLSPLSRFHPYTSAAAAAAFSSPHLFYEKSFLSPLAASLPFSPFGSYPLFPSPYHQKLLFPQSYLPPQLTELYQKKAAALQLPERHEQPMDSDDKLSISPVLPAAAAPEQLLPIDLSAGCADEQLSCSGSESTQLSEDPGSYLSAVSSPGGSHTPAAASPPAAGAPTAVEMPLDLTART